MKISSESFCDILLNLKAKIYDLHLKAANTTISSSEEFWNSSSNKIYIVESLFGVNPQFFIENEKKANQTDQPSLDIEKSILIKICFYVLGKLSEPTDLENFDSSAIERFIKLSSHISSTVLDHYVNRTKSELIKINIDDDEKTDFIDPHNIYFNTVENKALIALNQYCHSISLKDYLRAYNRLEISIANQDYAIFKKKFDNIIKTRDFSILKAKNLNHNQVDFEITYVEHILNFKSPAFEKLKALNASEDVNHFTRALKKLRDELKFLTDSELENYFIKDFYSPMFFHDFIIKYNIAKEKYTKVFYQDEELTVRRIVDCEVNKFEKEFFIKINSISNAIISINK